MSDSDVNLVKDLQVLLHRYLMGRWWEFPCGGLVASGPFLCLLSFREKKVF